MNYERYQGATGGIVEHELFGSVEINPQPLVYEKFRNAVAVVKKTQPFEDPSDPDPRFANDLHASVAELLGILDYKTLKFYTAVSRSPHKKTSLDFHHGIDAFFEYEAPNGQLILVTLDVTTGDKDDYKANVLIRVPPGGIDPNEEKDAYGEILSRSAQAIADIIKTKTTQTLK
ncbi:MAG: hypothetical protein HYT28_00995 [Parcubacteria group bacterium]|nr:hypothetical protein [Parcubacteria group bacterium]